MEKIKLALNIVLIVATAIGGVLMGIWLTFLSI